MSGTKLVCRHGETRLIAKADNHDLYAEIVGRGRRAYLWMGGDKGSALFTISGPKTLRRFAKAILEAVGEQD